MILLTLILALTAPAARAAETDLSGVYSVDGGAKDRAVVRKKGEAYLMRWMGERDEAGVALRQGDAIAYGCCACAETAGITLYRAEGKKLVGRSASCAGDWAVREETLSFLRPLSALPEPRKWKTGDTVLASWSKDDFWYPGTVLEMKEGLYLVRFHDGDSEFMGAERMLPDDIKAGDRVYARWQDGEDFYAAQVLSRKGQALSLRYFDGNEETTTLSAVRALRPRKDYE